MNELVEVVAHRWFRRMDEVMAWTSCRRRVTGERSVGNDIEGSKGV